MTISRVRPSPGGYDANGDPIPGTPTITTIDGAFVAPRTSSDVHDLGRLGVIVGLTLFVPYDTDLVATDKILVAEGNANDGTYEIEGQPGDWLHPMTGWQAGQTMALRRAVG